MGLELFDLISETDTGNGRILWPGSTGIFGLSIFGGTSYTGCIAIPYQTFPFVAGVDYTPSSYLSPEGNTISGAALVVELVNFAGTCQDMFNTYITDNGRYLETAFNDHCGAARDAALANPLVSAPPSVSMEPSREASQSPSQLPTLTLTPSSEPSSIPTLQSVSYGCMTNSTEVYRVSQDGTVETATTVAFLSLGDIIIGYTGFDENALVRTACIIRFIGVLEPAPGTSESRYDILTDCPVTADTADNLYSPISCLQDISNLPWLEYLVIFNFILRTAIVSNITDYTFLNTESGVSRNLVSIGKVIVNALPGIVSRSLISIGELLVTYLADVGNAIIACSSQGTKEACEDLQVILNLFVENGTTETFQAQVGEFIQSALGAANADDFAWYLANIARECMSSSTQVLQVPQGGTAAANATAVAVTSLSPNDVIIGYSGDAETRLERSLCRVLFVGENDSTGTGAPRYDVVTDCPVTSDTAGNLYTGLSCWEDMLSFPLTKYLPVYEGLRNVVVLFGITDYSFLIGDADESLVAFFGGVNNAIIACSSQGTKEACEDLQGILNSFVENGTTETFQAQVGGLIQSALGAANAADFAWYFVNIATECMISSTQVLQVPQGGTAAANATAVAVTSLLPNDVIIGYSGDAETRLERSLCRVLFVGENDSTGTGAPRYDVVTDCPVTSDTAGNLYTGLSCWEDMLLSFPLTKYLPVYEVLRNIVVLFGITDYSFLIGEADESLVAFFGGIGNAIIACSSQGTKEACEDLQGILNSFVENGTTDDFKDQVGGLIQSALGAANAADFAWYFVNIATECMSSSTQVLQVPQGGTAAANATAVAVTSLSPNDVIIGYSGDAETRLERSLCRVLFVGENDSTGTGAPRYDVVTDCPVTSDTAGNLYTGLSCWEDMLLSFPLTKYLPVYEVLRNIVVLFGITDYSFLIGEADESLVAFFGGIGNAIIACSSQGTKEACEDLQGILNSFVENGTTDDFKDQVGGLIQSALGAANAADFAWYFVNIATECMSGSTQVLQVPQGGTAAANATAVAVTSLSPNDVIIGYSGDAETRLERSLCRVLFVGENDSTGTGAPRYDVVTDCPVTSDTAGNLYTGISCWEDMLLSFPLTKYLPVYEVSTKRCCSLRDHRLQFPDR